MSSRTLLRGAIHVHSTLSHDGVLPPAGVAHFFRDHRYDFVCITEHSQDLNEQSAAELRDQCHQHSSDSFLLIPGLEFSCIQETHILGLGVTDLIDSEDPAKVIDHIHNLGGVAVLAHPDHRSYPLHPEWIRLLDGAEIWNVRSDGKFVPRPPAIRKFQSLREWHPELLGFFGVDFHQERSFYPMGVTLMAEALDSETILAKLKTGDFSCVSTGLHYKPRADVGRNTLAALQGMDLLINAVRTVRNVFRPSRTSQ